MADRVDIAVVGGGLAGLLAAATLARTGHSVALVAPPRTPDRRTTALLGGSVAALEKVGAWASVKATAAPLRSIRIVDGSRRLIRTPEVRFDAAELRLAAFGHNVGNEPLLAALDAAVDRAGVRRIEAAATGLRPLSDGIEVTHAGGAVAARLVAGADGHASAMRSAAGIGVERRTYPQSALVTTFSHARPHEDVSTEFHTEHGPFTVVPLLGNRSALVWVSAPEDAARRRALPPLDLAAEIETASQSILGAVTVDAPVQVFPLGLGMAERFAGDRVVLLGEAAHAMPPIGAQGFNVTVRDIEALAGLVAGRHPDPGRRDVTEAYDRERRRDAGRRATAVDMLNRSLLTDFLPAHLARGIGLFALANLPPLRRLLMRTALGTPTETGRPAARR